MSKVYYRPEHNNGRALEDQVPTASSWLNLHCPTCSFEWTRTHKAFKTSPICPQCKKFESSVWNDHPWLEAWLVDKSDKSPTISSTSPKSLMWCCPTCQFVFMSTVRSMVTGGDPCGRCNPQPKRKNGGLFLANHPQYQSKLVSDTGSDFFTSTRTRYGWSFDCGHESEMTPSAFLTDPSKCTQCRQVNTVNADREAYEAYCAQYGVTGTWESMSATCNRCKIQYKTSAKTVRNKYKAGESLLCNSCTQKMPSPSSPSLKDTIASWNITWSELNQFPPSSFSRSSGERGWWECPAGHTWNSYIYATTDNCPKCQGSSPENLLADFFAGLGLDPVWNTRNVITPYELDFWFPDLRIAIEFNGLYWHTESKVGKDYHDKKHQLCLDKGIQLITVWEDDFMTRPGTVKRMLARKLNRSQEQKVNARDCNIVTLTHDQASAFLDLHHIQGGIQGSSYLGLVSGSGELVAVMVLRKNKDACYLERYATSCIVRGGFTKLVKHFIAINPHRSSELVTFSDSSVSMGSLYSSNGWMEDGTIPADYTYLVNHRRVHKFNYRRIRFQNDPALKFDPSLSETGLAELNGIERIWGVKKTRWKIQIPETG